MSLIAVALQLAASTGLAGKLGKWIGGKNGEAVAEQVISIAQSVTGEPDPEKAAAAVLANKAQLMEFEEQVFQRELQLEKLSLQNVESARNLQIVALNQTDVFSKRFIYYLASAWTAFAFIYLLGITFTTVPEANVRFADTVLGFLLGTVIAGIIGFFFGSSIGRDRPDEPQPSLSSAR
jgi:hypothetical protein